MVEQKPTAEEKKDEKKSERRKVGRSPGYPSIPLDVALQKAEAIYKAELRHEIHVSTAMKRMGYGPKSGTGRLAFASLRKFGLIAVSGAKETRSARLTEEAVKLILDKRPDSPDRRNLLQRAALLPPIHKELWERYQGTLPSDDELRYRLQVERGFTDAGVRDFLDELRKTLAFAGVDSSTTIPTDNAVDESEDDDEGEDEELEGVDLVDATLPPPSKVPVGGLPPVRASGSGTVTPPGPRVVFPLSGNNVLELSLRTRVSKNEFETIKKLIDLAEASFVEPDS